MTRITKRKPYIRVMTPTWWKKLGFYRFYMLRESTAIAAFWFSLLLIYGLFALKNGSDSWTGFVHLLQNPLVLLINIIALFAALLHTKTWFELAPKAANLVFKGKKMGDKPVIIVLWGATVIATLVIFVLALI